MSQVAPGPIGVFDSGYGGLTILREIRRRLPMMSYLYLGDNARAPYGTRSFDVVYQFTLEAVRYLFSRGCRLVILACNTASAKALSTIQKRDLPAMDDGPRKVLGVILPTVEGIQGITATGHIGLLGTPGTVQSHSYDIEISKIDPSLTVTSKACPMWVPLVENREADGPGADYFVNKYINELFAADPVIDTLVLGCTHYPLLLGKIADAVDGRARIITQGDLVAESLERYLDRHPEIDALCSRGADCRYLTTEHPHKFNELASLFLNHIVEAEHVDLT
ncbi:MAG: glutamate racemase [Candidatus Amulumruptor caecigallinarius]|nr:glutamate racemase [Candidatus Amulumruptor caecigallinarius]MCM1396256.1 glutamate racemase [Candidatus Amulumruptor caecigallinarius]MCM1454308.1 glutamate racemase [bacterium]